MVAGSPDVPSTRHAHAGTVTSSALGVLESLPPRIQLNYGRETPHSN